MFLNGLLCNRGKPFAPSIKLYYFCNLYRKQHNSMENNTNNTIYSQGALDLVQVAAQTCLLLEHASEEEQFNLVEKLCRLLPLPYLKAHLLPSLEQQSDDYLQDFVTEEDYNMVVNDIKDQLGTDDSYLEVFVDDMRYSDEPITAFISENLADIYQELKNFVANYQIDNETVRNDALALCLQSFREHWGQKLLNALRALHVLWLDYQLKQQDNEPNL